jgi:sugar fermentation stimulation protein A
MKFDTDLTPGIIHKRYKRFLADIELENGEVITAHVANTGPMTTCWEPGQKVLMTFHDNPKRKLKYSLEMTNNGQTWINVNTARTNHLAKEAIEQGLIPELEHVSLKAEVKYGDSRFDFYLETEEGPHWVEVKNVTLKGDDEFALFPDAVTTRGQKHLREMIELAKKGQKATMLYIVGREDVEIFAPAESCDPEYAALYQEARDAGVQILAYQLKLTPDEIVVSKPIPTC